jgi:hypothetical protein
MLLLLPKFRQYGREMQCEAANGVQLSEDEGSWWDFVKAMITPPAPQFSAINIFIFSRLLVVLYVPGSNLSREMGHTGYSSSWFYAVSVDK